MALGALNFTSANSYFECLDLLNVLVPSGIALVSPKLL